MARELSVGDALAPPPGWVVLLKRGLRKCCARCGGGGLFPRWFRMLERCPRCGYLFEREPGFFVGASFVNFAVTEVVLAVIVVVFLFAKSADPGIRLAVPLTAGLVAAVVVPVVFHPWSRTIWAAIDLAMTPMELDEIAAAEDAAGATDAPGVPDDDT